MKTISFDEIKKEWFKNPEFVKEYDALEEEFSLASSLIDARIKAGMTQKQVAEKMQTTQSVIARLESGRSPSFKSLKKYAHALGGRIEVKIIPNAG